MDRHEILKAATEIVTNRESEYGSPKQNFESIAELWTSFLGNKLDVEILAADVAIMMCLLKIARLKSDTSHEDSVIDLCGYAALAGEVA